MGYIFCNVVIINKHLLDTLSKLGIIGKTKYKIALYMLL